MPSGIYKRTKEMKKTMSIAKLGCKYPDRKRTQRHSEEIRRKMSIERMGNKYALDTKRTDECKKNMSENKKGEKNPSWIKDRSKLVKRQERNDTAYKEWRMNVYKRDGFKCKIYNKDCNGRIIAHHILSWSSYPELRYQVNNGITLCQFHHPRKRADEKILSPYFKDLVMVKVK